MQSVSPIRQFFMVTTLVGWAMTAHAGPGDREAATVRETVRAREIAFAQTMAEPFGAWIRTAAGESCSTRAAESQNQTISA